MFYNARYYDPKIGRFITGDSIVSDATNPQSLNRYSYCDNNPIKFTDPTGHKKKKKWSWKGFFAFGVLGGLIGATKAGAYIGAMAAIIIAAPFTAGQSLWLTTAVLAAAGAGGGALGGGIGSAIDVNRTPSRGEG